MFVRKFLVFTISKLSVMKRRWKRSLLMLVILFSSITGLFASDATPIDSGATAWMLTSTALVLLMIPGLAMFYGGLVRSKNVLGTIMHSYVAMGIISVLWVIVGYSMSFGTNVLGGWFGWNPDYFFLKGIDTNVMDAGVPEYVFSMFQGKFAIITPALIAGAFAERISFKAYCFFIALWGLLVYNPLCHWVWASDGFLFNLGAKGAIDFAGGTVVHISAGVSGLVAAIISWCTPRLSLPGYSSEQPCYNYAWSRTIMGRMVWVQCRQQYIFRLKHCTGAYRHSGCCSCRRTHMGTD